MSDQPHQNALHLLNCHIYMLNHSSVEHSRRDIPPPTFLLQGIETLKDNTFPVGETGSNIGEVVTKVTGMHGRTCPVCLIDSHWSVVVVALRDRLASPAASLPQRRCAASSWRWYRPWFAMPAPRLGYWTCPAHGVPETSPVAPSAFVTAHLPGYQVLSYAH